MQQQPPPKMVVLQTATGEHLGFILLAVDRGRDQGQCIFMVLPPNPALFDSPAAEALFARKSLGENDVAVVSGSPLHLVINSVGLPQLIVEVAISGTGTWREQAPGTASGIAAVPAAA